MSVFSKSAVVAEEQPVAGAGSGDDGELEYSLTRAIWGYQQPPTPLQLAEQQRLYQQHSHGHHPAAAGYHDGQQHHQHDQQQHQQHMQQQQQPTAARVVTVPQVRTRLSLCRNLTLFERCFVFGFPPCAPIAGCARG